MQQNVIVSEGAIRDLIKEVLHSRSSNSSKEPVKVNNVVDPSAILTNPGNPSYKPDSFEELTIALSSMKDEIPQEKIPDVYQKMMGVIQHLNDKKGDKKMNRKDTKVESLVRSRIRKMIRENRSLFEALPTPARRPGRPKKEDGAEKKEYISAGDESEMALSDIAKALGKSTSGVWRDDREGRKKFSDNLWMYSIPASGMAQFRKAGIEFLNRLEKDALKQWSADPLKDTGESLVNSDDVPKLAADPQVRDAINLFVDRWLTDPENYEDPSDMISEDDVEAFRQHPEAVVTLPSFICVFLLDFLRDNYDMLDSLRTFSDSKEYKKVFSELQKKHKGASGKEVASGLKDVLRKIDNARE